MLDIFGIIFLVLEGLFLIYVVIKSIIYNEILSKKTIWYVVPLFILSILIHIVGMLNRTSGEFVYTDISLAINAAVKSFGFEMKPALIIDAINSSEIFKYAYYISGTLNGITLILALVGFFKLTIKNKIRLFIKKRKGMDVVVGYNETSLKYAKENGSIIWIDSNKYDLSYNEKVELFVKKIAFIYAPINETRVSRYVNLNMKHIHFICFMDDSKDNILGYIKVFINMNRVFNKDNIVYLHVEVKNEQLDFINAQISKSIQNNTNNLSVTCFSIKELLSRKFIMENNFLDYMPESFTEKGILKNEVNVFFLGFGSTNQSIFKANVLNNHFVRKNNGKLENYPVNYYLYDLDNERFNSELVTRLMMNYSDKKDGNHPIEKICNVRYKDLNIKSIDFINDIDSIIKKDSYNVFFINFSNVGENVAFTELLDNHLENKYAHFYYKVQSKKEIVCEGFSNRVSPYGFGNELLTHSIIANDSLSQMAQIINNRYSELKHADLLKWQKMSSVEKYSNIYNSINMKFKLQLIDRRYKDNSYITSDLENLNSKLFEGKSLEEINKIKSVDDYDYYKEINLRNALGYIEHLRWNAFYYIHNFNTLEFKDIKIVEGSAVTKNVDMKKHACLTSAEGLDELHHYLVKLYEENGIKKSINDVEVYKYDYMNIDSLYDNIKKLRELNK